MSNKGVDRTKSSEGGQRADQLFGDHVTSDRSSIEIHCDQWKQSAAKLHYFGIQKPNS